MKDYLQSFFCEFSYSNEDTDFLLKTYDLITQNCAAYDLFRTAVETYQSPESDLQPLYDKAAKTAASVGAHVYTVNVLLYGCMSKTLRRYYRERGIDETVFHDTMLDLRYKVDECKAVKGIIGTFVPYWYEGFFKMTRFALGRLQFEIEPFGADYEKDGHILTPSSRVINVHIPRTLTPLDKASCDAAYRQAREFFKGQYDEPCTFVCYSWLLCPAHMALYPPQSNMYRFAAEFDVFAEGIDNDRRDLWRLFDTDDVNPARLPTDTSVRRAFVAHLKNGGQVGWGRGVLFL